MLKGFTTIYDSLIKTEGSDIKNAGVSTFRG